MFPLLAACTTEPAEIELVVLAAASLADVLPRAAEAYEAAGGAEVTVSVASSAAVARQVEAGVPADLVVSADVPILNDLDEQDLLAAGTRRDLARNTLVAVVPADRAWTPAGPADLVGAEHLALAGERVPAGRYARAALGADLWTGLEAQVVTGDSVRTALAWVARGEADAGVVYATDAQVEPAVRVAFAFAAGSHPPIVYPAAVLARSPHPDEAAAFLDWLGSADGQQVFRDAGFLPP